MEERTQMLAEVMKYLRIGMQMREAREILLSNGFWDIGELRTNGVLEGEMFRRARSSARFLDQLFSSQVILIGLLPEGDVLREVSLIYFDRDPSKMSEDARAPILASDLKGR
jgi:hypothetical protein